MKELHGGGGEILMVSEIPLDKAAVVYIRASLEDGYTLSQCLLQLPLDTGRIVTYLPSTTPSEAVGYFDRGGVLPSFPELDIRYVDVNGQGVRMVPVGGNPVRQEIEAIMLSFIATFLQRPGRRYVVFDDALTSASDAQESIWSVKYVSYQAEVCLFLTSQDTDLATIIDTKRSATSYRLTGIFVAGEDLPDLTSGQIVDISVLRLLAERTEYMIIGAYDGESELLWSKT